MPEFVAEAHFLMGVSYYMDIFFRSGGSPTAIRQLQYHWGRTMTLDPNYVDWQDKTWDVARMQRVLNSVQKGQGRRSPHGLHGFGLKTAPPCPHFGVKIIY